MNDNNEMLKAFINRRLRLEAEKQDASDNIKELNAEIKGAGYDLAPFNAMISRSKKNRDDVDHFDAMLAIYEAAAGGK